MKALKKKSESSRIFLVLTIGFFIGIFNATLDVGASTLFLDRFEEQAYLPKAIVASGILGVIFTYFFAYLQDKMSFSTLSASFIVIILLVVTAIRLGFDLATNTDIVIFCAFVCIGPFNAIVFLIFWGVFGRIFSLRESKKIISRIDGGQLIASILALFAIPFILTFLDDPTDLLWISSGSAAMIFLMLCLVNWKYTLSQNNQTASSKLYSFARLIRNPYVIWMAVFVIVSMICIFFVNYSFLIVTADEFPDAGNLANFISIFSGTIIIFNFLIQNFVTDRIIAMYGLKVSLLINPLLLCLFTLFSAFIGSYVGYVKTSDTFIIFFLAIALGKLFSASLKDAVDNPTFKLYFLPLDANMRFNIQTRIEGVVTMFAGLIAGSILWLIDYVAYVDLIYFTYFLIPFICCWIFVITKLYSYYRQTLEQTLEIIKGTKGTATRKPHLINDVLKNEIYIESPEAIIHSLKLIERIEPLLLEQVLSEIPKNQSFAVQTYIQKKNVEVSLSSSINDAILDAIANNFLENIGKPFIGSSSPRPGKSNKIKSNSIDISIIQKLAKSEISSERISATQLLSQSVNTNNIFILLELLRDPDIQVQKAAIATAKKSKRSETWPLLIEMLSSPACYQVAANALIDSGDTVLLILDQVFHKGERHTSLLQKIIRIYGQIGTEKAIALLWNKIEHPDGRIGNEALLMLNNCGFQATGEKAAMILRLLETEISRTAWNQAAILELADVYYNTALKTALQEEMDYNFSRIFILLSLIYSPDSIQLVKENVESGTSEGRVYAIELLDVFIDKNLKAILFPLLDDIPASEEIKIYQAHFPRETLTNAEVLLHIINRDYNSINRWTKACAMYAIAMTPDMKATPDLTAHIFNPDILLRQTAAWAINKLEPHEYSKLCLRLPLHIRTELDKAIIPAESAFPKPTHTDLAIYQILFLKQTPLFASLPGLLLAELSSDIKAIYVTEGDTIISKGQSGNIPIYLILSGSVKWYDEKGMFQVAGAKELIGESLILDTDVNRYELIAQEETELYSIEKEVFYRIMANKPKLIQQFLENLNKKFIQINAEAA